MWNISVRIFLGKTSVMDGTLCCYGWDTSEIQRETVWAIHNKTTTALTLIP